MTEKDFNKIDSNEYCPFISKLVIKEHKKLVEIASYNNDKIYELHEKSNEVGIHHTLKIENLVIADKKTFEGNFVKFYETEFLNGLSEYATKVFTYITNNLEINNNKIIINMVKLCIYARVNEPRKMYSGLAELINKNIIAKHITKDVYYVNPKIVFRGSNRKILYTHKNY